MAATGVAVQQTVVAPGASAADVLDRVARAFAEHPQYLGAQVGTDRLQYVRTFRPLWATVTAILTLPLLGVGLLCLFVKRSEACTIVLATSPTGVSVSVVGRLQADVRDGVLAAVAGRTVPSAVAPEVLRETPVAAEQFPSLEPAGGSGFASASMPEHLTMARVPVAAGGDMSTAMRRAEAPAPPAARSTDAGGPPKHRSADPRGGPNEPTGHTPVPGTLLDEATSARTRAPGTGTPAPPSRPKPAAPLTPRVRFGPGQDLPLDVPIVIGRDPALPAGYPGDAQLCAASDPGRQVSKTHLALFARAGQVFVEDLFSTNGTKVVEPGGRIAEVPPGTALPVPIGARVRFGSLEVEVRPGA
jgi:hypothetical protein